MGHVMSISLFQSIKTVQDTLTCCVSVTTVPTLDDKRNMEPWLNSICQGETERIGEKPVPLPVRALQIPHEWP
jgi:hypothetical protein